MHGKSRPGRTSDGREAELADRVESRVDSLLGSGSRELRPRCARPEVLLELLVRHSRIPFARIAEVLGFEDRGDFDYWCERVTGHSPEVLRELGAPEPASRPAGAVLEMRHVRQAMVTVIDSATANLLIRVLTRSS